MRTQGLTRFVQPIFDLGRVPAATRGYARFLRDLRAYRELPGAEPIRRRDLYPQLHDWIPASPYDEHYFFQDVWAARRVAELSPARHVDVGSRVDWVGFLTSLTDVVFVDIRPLEAQVEREVRALDAGVDRLLALASGI